MGDLGAAQVRLGVAPSGEAVTAWDFTGALEVGGASLTAEARDGVVAFFDATGALGRVVHLSGPNDQSLHGVAVGPSGPVVLGKTRGEIDLGNGPLGKDFVDPLFLARYAP